MRSPWLIVFIAAIGAALILTFTFVRPPEPGKAGLRGPEQDAPPPPPVLPAVPAQDALPPAPLTPPSFDVVRVSGACTAVIAGSAEASMLVVVKSGEREIGRITADKDGEWVLVPDLPLQTGGHVLTLTGVVEGRAPVAGLESVSVAVPSCKPGESDRSEQAVAVLTRWAGGTRLLSPGPLDDGNAIAKGLGLDSVTYGESGSLALNGRAKPGGVIQVYINNQPLGAATADRRGRWALAPTTKIEPGLYTFRIDQVQNTGRVAPKVELPINRPKRDDLPKGQTDRIMVRPGDTLSKIAERVYGDKAKASAIYQANKSRIQDPNALKPGQVLMLPPSDAKPKRTSPANSR